MLQHPILHGLLDAVAPARRRAGRCGKPRPRQPQRPRSAAHRELRHAQRRREPAGFFAPQRATAVPQQGFRPRTLPAQNQPAILPPAPLQPSRLPTAATFMPSWLRQRNSQRRRPLRKRPNRIGAGQNQPIVTVKLAESRIQRRKTLRRANFQHRNLDRLGAQRAQALAELAGLMRCAGNQHPAARQWLRTQRKPPATASSGPAPASISFCAIFRPSVAGSAPTWSAIW